MISFQARTPMITFAMNKSNETINVVNFQCTRRSFYDDDPIRFSINPPPHMREDFQRKYGKFIYSKKKINRFIQNLVPAVIPGVVAPPGAVVAPQGADVAPQGAVVAPHGAVVAPPGAAIVQARNFVVDAAGNVLTVRLEIVFPQE